MKIKTTTNVSASTAAKMRNNKGKANKKRLFFIFFGAFVGFFTLCSFVAYLMTPKIDVPALNNEENLTSVTSNDFKGRVDPRLKTIEMMEDSAPTTTTTTSSTTTTTNTTASTKPTASTKTTNNNEVAEPQQSGDEPLPYDNRRSGILIPEDNSDQTDSSDIQRDDTVVNPGYSPRPRTVTPKRTVQRVSSPVSAPTPSKPTAPILREKIKVQAQPASVVRVMVGNYSDPMTARKASLDLENSNLNVNPFIREVNGKYVLQVGTFVSPKKAEKLAIELKKRNLSPSLMQE